MDLGSGNDDVNVVGNGNPADASQGVVGWVTFEVSTSVLSDTHGHTCFPIGGIVQQLP